MTSFLVSAERHNQTQLIEEISSLLDWQNIAILKFKFCLPVRNHSPRVKKVYFWAYSAHYNITYRVIWECFIEWEI